VVTYLTKEEIQGLFDLKYHLGHVDDIFRRLGLEALAKDSNKDVRD